MVPAQAVGRADQCAEIPASVAAFVEFLAHTGLLARGRDPPSQVRRYCERNTARFVREMANPANFGMAKSLFGAVVGLESGADRSPEGLAALIRGVKDLPPEPDRGRPAPVRGGR